jgi:hypothetical protein
MSVLAQFTATVSSVKEMGNKAVIPLAMKNNFAEKIESARATLFLLDDIGKVVGQSTKWVIGGSGNSGLAAGATNAFYFVIQSPTPFTTSNLTGKVTFNRVVLEGGKIVDAIRGIEIHE